MNFYKNLSIRHRIYFTAGFMMIFFALSVFLLMMFLGRLSELRDAEKQVLSFQTNVAKLQVFEGAFFQSDLQSNAFYYDDFSQNTVAFNDQYETILKSIDQIKQNYITAPTSETKYQEVVNDLNDYHVVFFEITGRLREMGNRDYGLIHRLIKVQEDIERTVVHQIKIALVTERVEILKRYQSSFIESGDISVLDNFERKYNDLNIVINAFPVSFFGGKTSKKAFQIRLREYFKWFSLVVEKQELIGNVGQSGLYLELFEKRSRVSEGLSLLQTTWAEEIEKQRSALTFSTYIYFSLSALIFIIIYFTIATGLIRPINTLQTHSKELARGVIPDELPLTRVLEINEINHSMNHFVEGLKKKISFSRSLGEGHFNAELNILSNTDQLGGSLLDMRDKLVQANLENTKNREEENLRNWYNEGSQLISSVLRLHSGNLRELSRNIVKTIVHYLDAIQTGFYSHEEENANLNLIASYAYDREKFQKKTFKLGEGLIGTVAIEKELLHLDKVPEDYLELASTFGIIQPASLVIVPLVVENELHGLIEVASFNTFEDRHLTFLRNVAKDIASSLASVKINQQTFALLEDSKRQAAELKEKERDVARNLEELELAKDQLRVNEMEAKALVASVDTGLIRIELDLKARIKTVNDKFLLILRSSENEFKGRSLPNFLPSISEAIFNVRWRKLVTGGEFFDVETVVKSKSKQVWSHLYFFPVHGRDNILTRVQVIGFDLSEMKRKENEFQNRIDEAKLEKIELEKEIVKKDKDIALIEKDILMKEIDYQALMIEKQKLNEEFNHLDTQYRKINKESHLKEEREHYIRHRMDLVMESLPIGVVIVSQQGYITFSNDQMARMISKTPRTIINKRFEEVLFDFDPFKLKTRHGYEASLSMISGLKLDARVTVVELGENNSSERIIFVEDQTKEKQRKKDFIIESEKLQDTISELRTQILKLESEIKDLKDKE